MYGTSKSSGPWRMTLSLRVEPRCPGCTEFLQPIVVEVRRGWAWCAPCVAHLLHRDPKIARALFSDRMCECSTIVNGVRFYTPEAVGGTVFTAYAWWESLECDTLDDTVPCPVDGVYAVTPAGEQLLSDLDVTGLLGVERDLKSVRAR